MQKSLNRPVLALTLVAAGALWFGNVNAQERSANTTAGKLTTARTEMAISDENRFDLRAYGARFQRAVEAIEADTRKPDWTWENSLHKERVAKTK